jgi:hypothetical protein
MIFNHINRLLWISIILTMWGLVGVIAEMVDKEWKITPKGLPASTLFVVGFLIGAIGQILIRMDAKIDVLAQRQSKLKEHLPKEPPS